MRKVSVFVILAVFAISLCSIPVVLGQGESIGVGTYQTDGLVKDAFNLGENIRIIAKSSSTSLTIIITGPDGVVVLNENYERAILGSSNGLANQYFPLDEHDVSDVRVWIREGGNWVKWQIVEDFSQSHDNSKHFIIITDAEGKSWVQFGDGVRGSRPPTGEDDVGATYRTSGGEEGNVVDGGVISPPTSIVYDKTFSGLTQKVGWYTVKAASPTDEVQTDYSCIFFNAVPEFPFGTISAVVAMLVAMNLYYLGQRRKHRLVRAN